MLYSQKHKRADIFPIIGATHKKCCAGNGDRLPFDGDAHTHYICELQLTYSGTPWSTVTNNITTNLSRRLFSHNAPTVTDVTPTPSPGPEKEAATPAALKSTLSSLRRQLTLKMPYDTFLRSLQASILSPETMGYLKPLLVESPTYPPTKNPSMQKFGGELKKRITVDFYMNTIVKYGIINSRHYSYLSKIYPDIVKDK